MKKIYNEVVDQLSYGLDHAKTILVNLAKFDPELFLDIMINDGRPVRYTVENNNVLIRSKFSCLFFLSWGFWNAFYYPHLNQWWSFAGGLFVVSANILWIVMMYYCDHKNKEDRLNNFAEA